METNAFAHAIQAWTNFYLLFGGASATLVGLMFVSLSINPEIMHVEKYVDVRALAQRTFIVFLNLLMIAGVMVIPGPSPHGIGIPLLCFSVLGLYEAARDIWRIRAHQHHWPLRLIVRRFASLILGQLAIAVAACYLVRGDADALNIMPFAILGLIFNACLNAWDMLSKIKKE